METRQEPLWNEVTQPAWAVKECDFLRDIWLHGANGNDLVLLDLVLLRYRTLWIMSNLGSQAVRVMELEERLSSLGLSAEQATRVFAAGSTSQATGRGAGSRRRRRRGPSSS